ncbi:MAG: circadian clock protein KaiA [Alkalinema sp. CAN_BIN05]|nr:circadian clock protein KaiA [Alkalinema sp. CAN_BIN05]
MTDLTDPMFASFPPEAKPETKLSVCCFLAGRSYWDHLTNFLPKTSYTLIQPQSQSELLRILEKSAQQIDCLLLQESPALSGLISWLSENVTLLPTVIIQDKAPEVPTVLCHEAEIHLTLDRLDTVPMALNKAIEAFLHLSPAGILTEPDLTDELGAEMGGYLTDDTERKKAQASLINQQQRLSEKLKERLGYLGVYYKRSPKAYLRNLPPEEQLETLAELKAEYRGIVLGYFNAYGDINQKIDAYIDMAFFADLPVSQVVETHMDVMDDFVKQLKLEGRNEDIVLDYRLTLIDTLAHLCEMYRRSIPKESTNPAFL